MRKGGSVMGYKLKYLSVPLPEDVLKLKYFGDIDRLNRVIDLKVKKDIPEALRQRLLLEKEIMALWARSYPHSQEKALEKLRAAFGDFSQEELEELRDDDAVEWTYINGEVRYKNNFLYNLIKTRPVFAERVVNPPVPDTDAEKTAMLDDTVKKMKEKGRLAARFHIRAELKVKPLPGREEDAVTVNLPIPMEYAQVRSFRLLSMSHPDSAVIAPPDFPQRTVRMTGMAKETFFVEYTYETHMRYVNPDPARALPQQPTFYTEEYAPHILFTPYLRALCREIVGNETNPLVKARKIYDFITKKMMYSFMRAYMTVPNVPEYGAACMKGDCGVQALLFITLCRIAGVPARWQSGLYVAPGDEGMHDWAQFYVAPYGWLFADLSFGNSAWHHGSEERWNFYFGNLDPYRMPANAEYQHDFFIPSRFLRYDPYDNQDGEAEYEDMRVPIADIDTDQKVLKMEWVE